ncbi:endolytic transglycosylase MltG [Coprobacter tertius]|uniref:Endolytic murein transglycosylase n=1 Tax=Coprobacter tertius TaxID=2944915 RepID=A0ABT1MGG9_9BACT|nr:endolytic transglycosylase MltG [Coprobacter tertius]MCP9611720.1 endolytic transglycosylase MltG [Coprobacter tertius]
MVKKRRKKSGKSTVIKILYIVAAIICILLVSAGIIYKRYMIDSFTKDTFWIYVDKNSKLEDILSDLGSKINKSDIIKFARIARINHYKPSDEPGAYRIEPGMGVFKTYRKLSNGNQTPIRFTFNNIRTTENLSERIGKTFMMQPEEIKNLLDNPEICKSYGFSTQTIPAMFIPDTYEVYWTIKPEKLLDRMYDEYMKFWNEDRKLKAAKIHLTPIEVSTLASIVEEETKNTAEMPIVAGVYINRLKAGMLLQADPTVKFALQDFSLRRILHQHLDTDSPYNTYKHSGLPPGPIRIPSKAAINSVLNYQPHNYVYMCAKDDLSGRHNFAETYAEHQQNAIRYQKALNERRIMK